jgi:hypothetical protein
LKFESRDELLGDFGAPVSDGFGDFVGGLLC